MRRLMLAALATLLLTAPVASAHHWGTEWPGEVLYFGDSNCYYASTNPQCLVDYLCLGGAPPQVVDTALYCAGRAAGEAQDVAFWAPQIAWAWLDAVAAIAEDVPGTAHNTAQPTVDEANVVLCTQVWSFFCSTPIVVPEHIPLNDPVQEYPL